MTLDQFETGLEMIIGRSSTLRPFICEGSPIDCDVFIVGYNPATSMDGDWWKFWKPGYGFEKAAWKQEYQRARHGEISKTRKCIETLVNSLSDVRVLEANIDARPSKRKSAYPKPVTAPFDYLITACAPRVVICHGVDAVEHLQGWKETVKLIECKHFIYVGKERRDEIVTETREALAVR